MATKKKVQKTEQDRPKRDFVTTGDVRNPKMRASKDHRETGDRRNPRMMPQNVKKGYPAEKLVEQPKRAQLRAEDKGSRASGSGDDHVTHGNDYQVLVGVDRANQPRK